MNTKMMGVISLSIGCVLIFVGLAYPQLGIFRAIAEKNLASTASVKEEIAIAPTVDEVEKSVPASNSFEDQSPITQTVASEMITQVVQSSASAVTSDQPPCPDTLQASELKGCLYEEWVKERFDKRIFSIETWNKSGSLDNTLTGSVIPDFYYKLETETKKEYFHVECVYRSSAFNGEVSWGSDEKVAGLNSYAIKASDPVFLILGVGGKPDMPEKVWIIKITGDTPGKYFLSELPNARIRPDADFKFDPVTRNLF